MTFLNFKLQIHYKDLKNLPFIQGHFLTPCSSLWVFGLLLKNLTPAHENLFIDTFDKKSIITIEVYINILINIWQNLQITSMVLNKVFFRTAIYLDFANAKNIYLEEWLFYSLTGINRYTVHTHIITAHAVHNFIYTPSTLVLIWDGY